VPPAGKAARFRAGAFSMGKDGMLGTKGDHRYRKSASDTSDDVVSWD
jgi:hypothetical protein